ncbi:MAG: DUF3667 domain-containing protein [Bacteroidota bacterium]
MEETAAITSEHCLNCGEKVTGKFCSSCGQKLQPTKVPLRIYLEDAVETLFNIDNRVFKTLKDLFLKPGEITQNYLEGQRAAYLPPLRIYLSISVLYFLIIGLTGSKQILFVNFGTDGDESAMSDVAGLVQFSMFLLVPLFGWFIKLFVWRRKAFFVEYLILSMHIHSVWFVISILNALLEVATEIQSIPDGSVAYYASLVSAVGVSILMFGYPVIFIKKVINKGWIGSTLRFFGAFMLYGMSLAGILAIYFFLFMNES